ncbi:MAG: DUF927 domain-containing protein, partial [Candidatus Obscuribacterales bacterium]|nr:DUF927 domain-containing protein [Candidatus Obscuribacterales bacterium]
MVEADRRKPGSARVGRKSMKTRSNKSPAGGKQGSEDYGTMTMIPNSNHNRIDFKTLGSELLNHSETICREYLPQGKRNGDRWISKNPTRNDNRAGSFSVNLKTGKWGDFATNDKGSDLVSLVAYLMGCSQKDGARTLQEKYGRMSIPAAPVSFRAPKASRWEPITPVPESAPDPVPHHHKYGRCSSRWNYFGEGGQLHAVVCRFDKEDGSKEILPYTYCLNKDTGEKQWRWKGLSAPRPLYNLNKLMDQPQTKVIITEGEKAADAAQELFGDTAVVTTSMHGAQSPHKTDWSPLIGRMIIIWPDYDRAGEKYAEAVAKLAKQSGAKEVLIIDIEKLKPGTVLSDGWDAADALKEGFTKDNLEAIGASLFKKEPGERQETTAFSPFDSREDGVYYNDLDPDKKPRKICSPLTIVADVCDQSDENWGRLLQITDRKGNHHQWCMPMRILSGSGDECRSNLLNLGLRIEQSHICRRLLMEYVQAFDPGKMARCVKKVGWHGDAFVLPDRVLQKPGEEEVVFQPDYVLSHGIQSNGTLDDWRNHVASTCRGNSRL